VTDHEHVRSAMDFALLSVIQAAPEGGEDV
jgi:hypothetical protein